MSQKHYYRAFSRITVYIKNTAALHFYRPTFNPDAFLGYSIVVIPDI